MTITHRPLTIGDAVALAEIIGYAQRGEKIARVSEGGEAILGTARAVTTESGGPVGDDDVRGAYLRVTTRGGWEVFWPIRDLIEEAREYRFTAYDWTGQ